MNLIPIAVILALASAPAVANVPKSEPGYRVASAATLPSQSLAPLVLEQAPETPTPAQPTEPTFVQRIWSYVAPTLATAIGALLVYLLGLLVTWVQSKSKESKFAAFVLPITEAARAVVLELDARVKPKLAKFLEDGVLSDAEKAQLRDEALAVLKEKLPGTLLEAGQKQLGGLLDTFLKGKIEQAVAEKNALQATADKAAPFPQ